MYLSCPVYSFLFGYTLIIPYNSKKKSKMKAARINLSPINFLIFGTITNASEPTLSHPPPCHNGLWSI